MDSRSERDAYRTPTARPCSCGSYPIGTLIECSLESTFCKAHTKALGLPCVRPLLAETIHISMLFVDKSPSASTTTVRYSDLYESLQQPTLVQSTSRATPKTPHVPHPTTARHRHVLLYQLEQVGRLFHKGQVQPIGQRPPDEDLLFPFNKKQFHRLSIQRREAGQPTHSPHQPRMPGSVGYDEVDQHGPTSGFKRAFSSANYDLCMFQWRTV